MTRLEKPKAFSTYSNAIYKKAIGFFDQLALSRKILTVAWEKRLMEKHFEHDSSLRIVAHPDSLISIHHDHTYTIAASFPLLMIFAFVGGACIKLHVRLVGGKC